MRQKWNLDGLDGYKYYTADKCIKKITYTKRQNSVRCGVIFADGKLPFFIMNGRFSAAHYIDMLDGGSHC